jgi:hypothetical protein
MLAIARFSNYRYPLWKVRKVVEESMEYKDLLQLQVRMLCPHCEIRLYWRVQRIWLV